MVVALTSGSAPTTSRNLRTPSIALSLHSGSDTLPSRTTLSAIYAFERLGTLRMHQSSKKYIPSCHISNFTHLLIVLKSARSATINTQSNESMLFIQHRRYIFSMFLAIWPILLGGAEGCFFKHSIAPKSIGILLLVM